jgi:hypothetical protein
VLQPGFVDSWLPLIVKVGDELLRGSVRPKPEPVKKESKKDKHGKAEDAKFLEQIERDEKLILGLLNALPVFFDILLIAWLDSPSQVNSRCSSQISRRGSFVCSTLPSAGIDRAMLMCVHFS